MGTPAAKEQMEMVEVGDLAQVVKQALLSWHIR